MENLTHYILDYNFIKKYDLNALEQKLVLPLFEDDIYSNCAICNDSDICFAKKCFFNLIKFINIKKQNLLFYLSDFDKRVKLFDLSKKCIEQKDFEQSFIEEFFSLLLEFAVEKNSSDIHIEANEKLLSIRFRIDGKLKHIINFDIKLYKILSSFIKLKSNLDITEYRKSLDSRISQIVDNKKYDFRISIMPTILGESIVFRILENSDNKKTLSDLGFSSHIYKKLDNLRNLTQGLILICGPTGSGKTTTLYSLLENFDLENKKIITVEDPVEYKLEGITQININEKIGLGFSTVLKSILRQDPDIIFIGEIRDTLSLQIAIQASLTGHLVLSTIHSNSALNAINRLIDLNPQNFLLSSTLKYIFYQRLVLQLCPYCNFKGCKKCNYTRYKGRTTLCEFLEVDNKISSLISKNAALLEYKEYLKQNDYKDIYFDGKLKSKKQMTTLEEVYNVLGFENEV
ncbi:transformation system protein [Malaciobacter molluscorum]|uniref:GspE/PulE family protein n=1 Tax=Malaciobacter molluscorum TaxID=1032072 RepID=UPI00100B5347|nr:GspE/PulE family protein [Malaciobacter molluscorum]RXJ94854.1 transformation system protein [Malaciobacter molluscorum]